MDNPKLSIIIATFNAAKTLERALQSVVSLKYQDWECILVDGASKDNTVEIIKQFVTVDSRIRYLSEPDKGIYDAFNKGWKLARGEWIYYLGADDQLLPNAFLRCMSECDGYDVVYGYTLRHSRQGLKKGNCRKDISYIRKGMICNHQALMMKKELFEVLGGFDTRYKIVGDSDLILRSYLKGYLFKHIDEGIAIFAGGGASSSFAALKESFLKRKRNKSVSIPVNIICTFKYFFKKVKSVISQKIFRR